MPTIAKPAAPGRNFAMSGISPETMPSAARSHTNAPAIAATWCLTARPSPTPIAVHSTVAPTNRPTTSAIADADHAISTPLASSSGTPIAIETAVAANVSALPPPGGRDELRAEHAARVGVRQERRDDRAVPELVGERAEAEQQPAKRRPPPGATLVACRGEGSSSRLGPRAPLPDALRSGAGLWRDDQVGDPVTVERESVSEVDDVTGKVACQTVADLPQAGTGHLHAKKGPRKGVLTAGLVQPVADLGRTAPLLTLVMDRRLCGEGRQSALYIMAVVGILVPLNHLRDLCSHLHLPVRPASDRISGNVADGMWELENAMRRFVFPGRVHWPRRGSRNLGPRAMRRFVSLI